MITPTTSIRIPSDLREEFDSVREKLGINQTDALLQAIQTWVFINNKGESHE
ncbi:hypothetical protein [Anabaena sp. CCY 9402-a]|uniref:hypothetical protein n=1 Tax=Anabaena sp. CCY 9402-a TaxID=3103867 RepID=UPI0039C6ACE4